MFGTRMGAQMDENTPTWSPASRTAHFNDAAKVQSKERRLTRLGVKLGSIGASATASYPDVSKVWET